MRMMSGSRWYRQHTCGGTEVCMREGNRLFNTVLESGKMHGLLYSVLYQQCCSNYRWIKVIHYTMKGSKERNCG